MQKYMKRMMHHDQDELIPGMLSWFNIQKSIKGGAGVWLKW
jgi:hypothetical protein